MHQKPGELVGNMLWLVPRYVETQGTLVKLGSILTDPKDLESSLNLDAIPTIPAGARRDASTHVRHHIHSEIHDSNSLLAKTVVNLPLFGAGASAGGKWAHGAETMVDVIDVKAEVFIPDKKFMQEAMKHEAVIEYASKCMFSKSLYIIVGVATASELSITEKQDRQHGTAASVHLTAPNALGEIDGAFERERDEVKDAELNIKKSCDFAYRVRKFVYTRIRGLKDKGNYGESAMFGRQNTTMGKSATAEKEVEDLPQFLRLGEKDVTVPECMGFIVPEEVSA